MALPPFSPCTPSPSSSPLLTVYTAFCPLPFPPSHCFPPSRNLCSSSPSPHLPCNLSHFSLFLTVLFPSFLYFSLPSLPLLFTPSPFVPPTFFLLSSTPPHLHSLPPLFYLSIAPSLLSCTLFVPYSLLPPLPAPPLLLHFLLYSSPLPHPHPPISMS